MKWRKRCDLRSSGYGQRKQRYMQNHHSHDSHLQRQGHLHFDTLTVALFHLEIKRLDLPCFEISVNLEF